MRAPDRSWPPLIHAALPAWMTWRDAALTLAMWVVFVVLLQRQFSLVTGGVEDDSNIVEFIALLRPYGRLAVVLILLLVVAAAFTARRRRRAAMVPAPAPLALADEARRAGVDEATLAAARSLRIAVVRFDDAGRVMIEPR
jgi:poly-beta-1,6-N-acetyl-D-glucosamine biosynthesis protein PgaD